MSASKRVAKELESLQAKLPRYLRNLFSHDADVLVWHALLLPEKPPYNLKAFHLRINFPEDYPFKPPTVTFTTRIYHPNVGHNGEVCLPITSKENWSPYTKTCQGASHTTFIQSPSSPIRSARIARCIDEHSEACGK
ncbi:ubiquitin/ISG15-conjugating enzyme E2 L6 isoform X2 [Lynx rufus]|uniref:ubiquitin/ISG15-conjugating enzyme E2 L6 isoform X2 n=1 Tax=Lynx rufus TaxID=61384 RepID=UPI001F12404E|nr:ubiquitin/ISG15-conjugating enzyme E2 L6 isoform X2 [Lynx rufus]